MADLHGLWTRDVARLAPEAETDRYLQQGSDLLDRWGEAHRRYHTTTHLAEMFAALDELADAGELDALDTVRARVAAWFHDAVYDPTAGPGRNEHRSAQLSRDHLHHLGADPADIDAIESLILMTAGHDAAGRVVDTGLGRAFHDVDLWILSAPAGRFDEYCGQVREEYVRVPDAAYRSGRSDILRPLLEAEPLYLTGHAQHSWQPRARANLARELSRLR